MEPKMVEVFSGAVVHTVDSDKLKNDAIDLSKFEKDACFGAMIAAGLNGFLCAYPKLDPLLSIYFWFETAEQAGIFLDLMQASNADVDDDIYSDLWPEDAIVQFRKYRPKKNWIHLIAREAEDKIKCRPE